MKMNLRRAAQLRDAIDHAIKNKFTLQRHVTVSVYETDPVEVLNTARRMQLETLTILEALEANLFYVRQAIAKANMEVGIAQLLNTREQLTRSRARQMELSITPPRLSAQGVSMLLEGARRTAENPESYDRRDTVHLPFMEGEDRVTAEQNELGLRRELREIDDQLLGLNIRTTIDIPEESIEFLTKAGII